jgi:hypothetical protein
MLILFVGLCGGWCAVAPGMSGDAPAGRLILRDRLVVFK